MYFLAPEGMERLSASLKVALRNGHVPKNGPLLTQKVLVLALVKYFTEQDLLSMRAF